jgi:hypothetical protein
MHTDHRDDKSGVMTGQPHSDDRHEIDQRLSRDTQRSQAGGRRRKWQWVVLILASVAIALWGFNSWFERQDWIPESKAARLMGHARLQCTQSMVTTYGDVYPGWVDRHGRNFYATGPGRGPLKAALEVCARANLGSGVAPFDWLRFFVIGLAVIGVSATPLLLSSQRESRIPPG